MLELTRNFKLHFFGLERRKKHLIQIIFDGLIVPISLLLAFLMRLETFSFLHQFDAYICIVIALLSAIPVFAALGLYKAVTRHISIENIVVIAVGSAVSCTVLLSSILLLELQVPRSVPLIYALILYIFSAGIRVFVRFISQKIIVRKRENVAIYGAGAAGIQLMEAMRTSPFYRVRLFIDDNPDLIGKNIAGVPINNLGFATAKFKKMEIETLLLAIPTNIEKTRKKVFDILSDYPLKVKTIPSIRSLISGTSHISELKDIKIEDLLGRIPARPDPELITKNISKKTVLVTGAGGSIGSELCRTILNWNAKTLILLDISEFSTYQLLREIEAASLNHTTEIIPLIGSVQDVQFLKTTLKKFSIDTIYHAAAYKHVPLMESNVAQCIINNVCGTFNMAKFAIDAQVKSFTLISTDKAVKPTSYMGISKRLAEIVCQTLNESAMHTRFSVVRFGNVLGSSGSVVPLFKNQIDNGGPITLTHPDVTRYFMTIPEAAQLVIQAGAIAKGGEIFVLDMGKPIEILELAKKMIILSGLTPIENGDPKPQSNEILIRVTGLRPGEKLYEELSYDNNLLGTVHPRIMKAAETPKVFQDIHEILAEISVAAQKDDKKALSKLLYSLTGWQMIVNETRGASKDHLKRKSKKVAPLRVSKD